jgi:hypothetical protein
MLEAMEDDDLAKMTAVPFEACMACMRGDTTTGIALRGSAEMVVEAFMRITGSGRDVAEMVLENGDFVAFALCSDCAARAGVSVAEYPLRNLPVYECIDREALCGGSFDAPADPRGPTRDGMPGGTCPECGYLVEIHPIEPGGREVWRLEAHDRTGNTRRMF